MVYACDEALRIIDQYEMPEKPAVEMEPRAGFGYGCTEAPRGILYHRYRIDGQGSILDAKIVPPTSPRSSCDGSANRPSAIMIPAFRALRMT